MDEYDKIVNLLGNMIKVKKICKFEKGKKYAKGTCFFENNEFVTYIIDNEFKDLENEYNGEIIGIIKIRETNEIRLVVSTMETKMYYNEIKGYFQNDPELKNAKFKCLYEKSAGVIIYKIVDDEPRFLIVYSKKNIPGFPKGHIEYGENEKTAAKREVMEEVGIDVEINEDFREVIQYNIKGTPINKEVVLFLAKTPWFGYLDIDENEISKYEILKLDIACKRLGDNLISVLKKANNYIKKF